METKFRNIFRNDFLETAEAGDAPFHKLFNGVVSMGQVGYTTVFTVAIIVAMCACAVVFFKIYIANSAKDIADEKEKLQRNLLMVFFTVILGSLGVMIFNAFLW